MKCKKINLLKIILGLIFIWSMADSLQAQIKLTGRIKDEKGNPVPYANIYIEKTIDGTTSDSTGRFAFKTDEKGIHVIIVTCIGYKPFRDSINLNKKELNIDVKIKEESTAMQEVVVTAGAFEANDDQKVAMLKPLDIYTNAGAGGDITGAIRSLPGTQAQSDQTGLFVRGGDASESVVVVDGMMVQNPFASNVPGVSQRSRFTPFQFKGISFSSGGYSARFGQALSSVLELNTFDLPENSNANLSAGMTGVEASATKKWNSSAVEFTGHYDNLKPFFHLAKSNIDFYEVPTGGGFSGKYTLVGTRKDLLKAFIRYETASSGTNIMDPDSAGHRIPFGLKNDNIYFNTSYTHVFGNFLIRTAASASSNTDHVNWNNSFRPEKDRRIGWRGELFYSPVQNINFLLGSEFEYYRFSQSFLNSNQNFNESLLAGYFEAEWKPVKWLAFKPGARLEHSELLNSNSLAPRMAMAIGTGQYSQVSFASGKFFQDPDKSYLLMGYRPNFQEAIHYIANYQRIKDDRTFRIEGYYKSYSQLVRELLASNMPYNPSPYRRIYGPVDNSGKGYAKGVDIFWRDKNSIQNFDYWISYSYVDTKRLYQNLKDEVTPSFVSNHNLNILLKYFIEPLQLNIGTSYTYASGRPFYDPGFKMQRIPDYHDLAFNVSYLLTVGRYFAVAYASVDNLTGRRNIFGYSYSYDGTRRFEIKPALYRWIYAGFTISLTKFKKEEL